MQEEASNNENISPDKNKGLWFTKPLTSVGGITSVWRTLTKLGKFEDVPTIIKSSLKMNQKKGFDCPGCAWPDPDDYRSKSGEYCSNGLRLFAEEISQKKADPRFFAHHKVSELRKWPSEALNKVGRLSHPMIIQNDEQHYTPIEWDDAFRIIIEEMNKLDDPNQAAFYSSGRTSNEAAFLYGVLARGYGTNNLPTCSNLCHDSSHEALKHQLGNEHTTVRLSDIYKADLIIILGLNPGNNHPRMLKALKKCKKNGGKIITINPLKEAGLINVKKSEQTVAFSPEGNRLADQYLQIRMNGDVHLLKAILYLMYQREEAHGNVFHKQFIEENTVGYDALISNIKQTDYTECVRESGIDELSIIQAVDTICESRNCIVCWGTGVSQQLNSKQIVHEIINLLLLKGTVGREGSGPFPVTGHSNVNGIKRMGVHSNADTYLLKKMSKEFNFELPDYEGFDAVKTGTALIDKKIKALFSLGGNLSSALPDTTLINEALLECDLSVQICTKLNQTHLYPGKTALLLPVLGRSEIDVQQSGYQFVTTEDATNKVRTSKGTLAPRSEYLKSEIAVICELGRRLFEGCTLKMDWEAMMSDYDNIREKIQILIPGFASFNKKIRIENEFFLPNPVRNKVFMTAMSKALFVVNDLPKNNLDYHEFQIGSIRSKGQFNSTIFDRNDPYRGVFNSRNIVLMNVEDMNEFGYKPKDRVNIHSEYSGVKRSVYAIQIIPYEIPRRNLMTYFPEANPLIPLNHISKDNGVPAFKNVIVKLEPVILRDD